MKIVKLTASSQLFGSLPETFSENLGKLPGELESFKKSTRASVTQESLKLSTGGPPETAETDIGQRTIGSSSA